MRRLFMVAGAALLVSAMGALAQVAQGSDTPPGVTGERETGVQADRLTTEEFVDLAAMSILFDIEAAELASRRALDDTVRDFSARLLADRRAALQDLRRASGFPGLPEQLDDENRRIIEALEKEEGAEFDASFVGIMIDAHEDSIDLYEEFLEGAADGAIENFVASRVESLRVLADEAHALGKRLDSDRTGGR